MNTIASCRSFDDAAKFLAGREEKKIAHNTWVVKAYKPLERYYGIAAECYAIRYHDTEIIRYDPDGSILIDCNGWLTRTTKDRLNEFTPFTFYGSCRSGYSIKPVSTNNPWHPTYYGGREAENAGENWELMVDGESFYYLDGMKMIPGRKNGWNVRYPK